MKDAGGNLTPKGTQMLLQKADDARKRLREEGPPPTLAEDDRRQVELITALLDKHGVDGGSLKHYNPTPYGRLWVLLEGE